MTQNNHFLASAASLASPQLRRRKGREACAMQGAHTEESVGSNLESPSMQ